ncbi:hypothetical protein DRO59_00920 [Candidatus Bathyarchaeota archaeon]|nr:MAG: hypothetical protein DRO59_00920 [Candidatus Bathyarchaeota archaeon]
MDKSHKRQWMQEVAFRAVFRLDKVIRGVLGDLVIYGHYDDVEVTISYQYHLGLSFACVTLQHSGVSSSMVWGRCYEKVLVDAFRAVLTSEGRLWRLKEDCLRHFVDTIKVMAREWSVKADVKKIEDA